MKRILALLLCLLPFHTSLASWADIPLEKVVASSQLVVRGKIVAVEHAPAADYAYDTATIQVDEVLKDQTDKKIAKGTKIHLSMPAKNNRSRESTDILYPEGHEGFWILEFKDGKYLATYPKDYQPLTARDAVTKALADAGK